MGRRTQAERDAITVEIGFAWVSAAFVAAVTFGGIVCPLFFFDLPSRTAHLLVAVGGGLAVIVFLARVVLVLWRFGGRPPQQSQPGRTRPDS
ncbi:DUF6332 family protein [Streptomyces sp. NPDC051320]|uniref:DUF6332 family protein n=1 Tax=Streptomyces sp. NPDC051320 TaxID=3154644 RepID=UPI003421BA9B